MGCYLATPVGGTMGLQDDIKNSKWAGELREEESRDSRLKEQDYPSWLEKERKRLLSMQSAVDEQFRKAKINMDELVRNKNRVENEIRENEALIRHSKNQ
jgi:hypothetical protein